VIEMAKILPKNGVIKDIIWLAKSTDEVRERVKRMYIVPNGSKIIVSRVITMGNYPKGLKTYEVEVYSSMHGRD
jgi:hypothetical protein